MNVRSASAQVIEEGRGAQRQTLIWKAVLHHDNQSSDVRVRNISASGALIESPMPVRIGAESRLEFGDSLSMLATIQWVVGNQIGLRFHWEFELNRLGSSRPTLATSGWEPPAYLGKCGPSGLWTRARLQQLREELEGFMKR